MENISDYLLNRELVLSKQSIDEQFDPVLMDEGLLQEVAGLWSSHRKAIEMVIQARVNAIGNKILRDAIPQETIVLRQSLVEVGAVVDDFIAYSAEWDRRSKPEEQAETPPANNEGTL